MGVTPIQQVTGVINLDQDIKLDLGNIAVFGEKRSTAVKSKTVLSLR